jgi:2'-phosphotransferase
MLAEVLRRQKLAFKAGGKAGSKCKGKAKETKEEKHARMLPEKTSNQLKWEKKREAGAQTVAAATASSGGASNARNSHAVRAGADACVDAGANGEIPKAFAQNLKEKKDRDVSMALSQLLRHTALNKGVAIAPDGFAYWDDVAKLKQFAGVEYYPQIERIVADNNKQRFMLKTDPTSGKKSIRCNQGHSFPEGTIDPDKLLTPITAATVADYPFVVHGCPTAAWLLIKKTGLNKMSRQHVHMAVGLPESGNVISGMRNSSKVTIEIDLPAALAAGIPFFISANNVVLSPGAGNTGILPTACFRKVVERKSGKVLFGAGVATDATASVQSAVANGAAVQATPASQLAAAEAAHTLIADDVAAAKSQLDRLVQRTATAAAAALQNMSIK